MREEPDRDGAHALRDDAEDEDEAERSRMAAIGVQRVVERPQRRLDAQRARERGEPAQQRAQPEREERDCSERRGGHDAEAERDRRAAPDARAARERAARGQGAEGREPDDAVDDDRRHRLGARAGAPREVDRPHGVAADGRGQDLARAGARSRTSRRATRARAHAGRVPAAAGASGAP